MQLVINNLFHTDNACTVVTVHDHENLLYISFEKASRPWPILCNGGLQTGLKVRGLGGGLSLTSELSPHL
jgi:hypothetical protein